jgi:hypothetical protein
MYIFLQTVINTIETILSFSLSWSVKIHDIRLKREKTWETLYWNYRMDSNEIVKVQMSVYTILYTN